MTLFLAALVFAPLAFGSVEPWALALLQLTVFITAARLYVKGLAVYPNALYKTLLPAVLAIVLIGLLQAAHESPVNGPASLFFTAWRPATLKAVLLWLFYAAILFSVPQLITTPERFTRLIWTIFAMGVAITLLGMFQKTGDNTMVYGLIKVPGDAFGPFINRDHGAYYLIMAAMAGLGIFFSGWRDLAAHKSHTRLFDLLAIQLLKLVMIAALVYGIYHTGSRGGIHSFAATAAVLGFISAGFLHTRKLRLAAVLGLTLLAVGYGAFISRNEIMLGLKEGKLVSSVTIRLSMYKSGMEMMKDFPYLGTGLGALEYAFPPYKRPDVPALAIVQHVHSDWLELFLQTGCAGGLIYIAGLAAALFGFFRTWRHCRSFRIKALYGGALGAVLGATAHNLVEFGLQMPANSLLYYTLLGALARAPPVWVRRRSPDEDPPEPAPVKKGAAFAATALATLLCLCTLPPVIGWWYNQRAEDAPYQEKVKRQAAALFWNPSPEYAFRLGMAHYTEALANPASTHELLLTAQATIAPWLKRAPTNYNLLRLNKVLEYFTIHPLPLPKPK